MKGSAESGGLEPPTVISRSHFQSGVLIQPDAFRNSLDLSRPQTGGKRGSRTPKAVKLAGFRGQCSRQICLSFHVVRPARVELAAFSFGGRHSNPLSYERMRSPMGDLNPRSRLERPVS